VLAATAVVDGIITEWPHIASLLGSHAAASPAVSPAALHAETADNHNGSLIFASIRPGSADQLRVVGAYAFGDQVEVTCYTPNTTGQMSSVTGFYRIGTGRFAGGWTVADTFVNVAGATAGTVNDIRRDLSVPDC